MVRVKMVIFFVFKWPYYTVHSHAWIVSVFDSHIYFAGICADVIEMTQHEHADLQKRKTFSSKYSLQAWHLMLSLYI